MPCYIKPWLTGSYSQYDIIDFLSREVHSFSGCCNSNSKRSRKPDFLGCQSIYKECISISYFLEVQFREEAVCLLIPSLFFHSEYCWHSPLIISRTLPSLYSTSLPSQVPFSDNFSASLPPHLGLGSHTFTQLSLYVVAFSQSLGSKEFNCSLRCPI